MNLQQVFLAAALGSPDCQAFCAAQMMSGLLTITLNVTHAFSMNQQIQLACLTIPCYNRAGFHQMLDCVRVGVPSCMMPYGADDGHYVVHALPLGFHETGCRAAACNMFGMCDI